MVCVRRFEKFTRLCLPSVTSWQLSALHREPTHGDYVPCYRGPGRMQAGTVRQFEVRIQRIDRKSIRMDRPVLRARRVVASRARTILCLPGTGREPVLRNSCCGWADVEHDPVHKRGNRRLAVIHDDRE